MLMVEVLSGLRPHPSFMIQNYEDVRYFYSSVASMTGKVLANEHSNIISYRGVCVSAGAEVFIIFNRQLMVQTDEKEVRLFYDEKRRLEQWILHAGMRHMSPHFYRVYVRPSFEKEQIYDH